MKKNIIQSILTLVIIIVYSVCSAQKTKQDTAKVTMLVCDTSDKPILHTDYDILIALCDSCPLSYKENIETDKDRQIYWLKGYEVTSIEYKTVDSTVVDKVAYYKQKRFYSHKCYLDTEKKLLPNNIIVWQVMSEK